MRTKTLFSRLTAGAAVLAVAGGGLLISEVANAQTPQPPPSGTIAFDPVNGSNVTIVFGTPSGPCDVPGSSLYDAVVAGPGAFAPDPTQGRPDGVTFRGASDVGFQTTSPIRFNARLSFQDLALELGLTAVPVGDYVVTFRCVDDVGTIFQTYRSTITFTTPTTYTSQPTATPTPTPVVTATPTPTPVVTATPTPTPSVTATTTQLTVVTKLPHIACQIVGSIFNTQVPRDGCTVLIARVSPQNATGTVAFTDVFRGTTRSLGSAPVGVAGLAVKLTPTLAEGTHVITAKFTDGTRFGPSSDTKTVRVD